jgi:hypothetical protein
MKLDTPAPLEKLAFFKKKLGLDEKAIEGIDPYRNIFADKH